MKKLFPNTHVLTSFVVLTLGELLYLFHFRALFLLALIYFVAVAIPYPRVCRSLLSRLAVSAVLCLSLLQLVAAVQFYVLPHSGFLAVSLITYVLCVIVMSTAGRKPSSFPSLISRQDLSAIVMVLFFVLPVGFLFFKTTDAVRILSVTSTQSPDAVAHYSSIVGMEQTQHLDYRTNAYYPRGFHFASAFVLDAVHLDQRDLSWVQSERLFAGLYVVWGAALGYLIYLFAYAVLQELVTESKRFVGLLLGLMLGPITTLLYLVPFVYLGFINYYYICAAILGGLLFMMHFDRRKLFDWSLVAYAVFMFGVSMSWGPLFAPALFLIPALYIVRDRSVRDVLAIAKTKQLWVLAGFFIIEMIPVYLHLKYAHLSSSQGVNATGIMTSFNYGVDLVGLGILAYYLARERLSNVGDFIVNSLLSFFVLLGIIAAIQYFTVGELRYYAIKISYLVEMMILGISAAGLMRLAWKRINTLRVWIGLPLVFTLATIFILGMTSDPFLAARQTFRHYSNYPSPQHYSTDIAAYARLGEQGKLMGDNSEVLHYDTTAAKIYGDGLVQASADSFQRYGNALQSRLSKDCAKQTYNILVYGDGSSQQQRQLVNDLQQCVTASRRAHVPYFVVTDRQSEGYLRPLLGSYVQFVN